MVKKSEASYRPVIVGCKTLEKELLSAMSQTACDIPIIWIESGLHNIPRKLFGAIEDAFSQCEGYTHILMAMGFCGETLLGAQTRAATLVIPRVDDCISLLLGSMDRRNELNAKGCYYFTEGWLKGERTIMVEYQHAVARYGQKRADMIFANMLRHYNHAVLIDTGCYDYEAAIKETQHIAQTFHLSVQREVGTLSYLKELISGHWPDKRFVIIPPNTIISDAHLRLPLP